MVTLISVILLCPLGAFAFFAILALTGRNSNRQDLISTFAMIIAFLCAFLLFMQVLGDPDSYKRAGGVSPETHTIDWIQINNVSLSMGFLFDSVTSIMLLVVTIVSGLVHIFSIGYMHGDPRYPRFFAYLSLFSFSMLFLVVADNLLGIYIGWELVGLCSYLLIGFWFEKDSAANACKKAFLTTRVGDVGMFIGMMMLFTKFHTFVLFGDSGIFEAVNNLGSSDLTWLSIAGILIFCGAIGKSAQFPLHTWLPDAMEGPTPVSALIHAATMVAAGVYLAARMFPILTGVSSLFIAYVGGITAIFAATIAIVQWDIKRVLAYSTVSQLGYMMLAIGASSYVAGLFHLTTHAFFKALLFLGSGSVIHALHVHHHDGHDDEHSDHPVERDGIPLEQDMRNMGGLRHKMPITFWTMLIATLSISGVPFLFSGFWSKDEVLGATLGRAMESGSTHYYILFFMALVAAGATALYMFRLIFLTFMGQPRNQGMYEHAHESPRSMIIPLIILAVLSFPIVNKWSFKKYVEQPEQTHNHLAHKHANQPVLYVAVGAADHHDSTSHVETHGAHSPAHSLAMGLSIFVVGLGILLSALFYHWKIFSAETVANKFRGVHRILWNKYFIDEFYDGIIVRATVIGAKIFGGIDKYLVDGLVNLVYIIVNYIIAFLVGLFDDKIVDFSVNLVAKITWKFGGRVRRIQTGVIQNYLFVVLAGVILLIIIFRLLV
ncbi:TPA: NADH-quinone oxidoreductase subunit L [Candidatus Poribacteria bacterium]|nr:NADH-quinone oxidoreductase subunit L [Candidatus Poribacteria bacterium]HIA65228.1 NADH-quinone oxidoreductase subunit L [Candidatus Poribacteria bacterium]HIB89546.1 NADH-quinone oxidoreductase subunit L [Candidatus Poribacteria bacterium]HIB98463.1 NADH-quinone oxidoreductase subunit L [Candidatus Poribacteria bacterium]HIN28592.1 NADH-quinone oxidoreductase subunit L [Candidatus Poribacteria bacterium]